MVKDHVDDPRPYAVRRAEAKAAYHSTPASAGPPASSDPIAEHTARNIGKFNNAGGQIDQLDGSQEQLTATEDEMDQLHELMDDVDWSTSDGTEFTQHALDDQREWEGDATILVAREEGLGISGAISLIPSEIYGAGNSADALYVPYLGTTGITDGAGTALVQRAAQVAASQNRGLVGHPTPGARAYWEKLGWHDDPNDEGIEAMGWTATETKRFAETGTPTPPPGGIDSSSSASPAADTGVEPILDKWVQQGGSGTLSDAERQKVTDAVQTQGVPVPAELHRGAVVPMQLKAAERTYRAGQPVNLPASSFSTDEDQALPYAENTDGPNETGVVFHLKGQGVKGLDVGDRAWDKAGFSEGEWITAGQFKVAGDPKVDDDGLLHVDLTPNVPETLAPTHPGAYHATADAARLVRTGFTGQGSGDNGAFFGKGTYFHTNPADAKESLAGYRGYIDDNMTHVQADVTLRRPFQVDADSSDWDPSEVMNRAMVARGLAKSGEQLSPSEITKRLEAAGYDGVEVKQKGFNHDIGGSQIVAFHNHQIGQPTTDLTSSQPVGLNDSMTDTAPLVTQPATPYEHKDPQPSEGRGWTVVTRKNKFGSFQKTGFRGSWNDASGFAGTLPQDQETWYVPETHAHVEMDNGRKVRIAPTKEERAATKAEDARVQQVASRILDDENGRRWARGDAQVVTGKDYSSPEEAATVLARAGWSLDAMRRRHS